MKNYYWNLDGWNENVPENADEIISAVNDILDEYAEKNGEEAAENLSAKLWDSYCSDGNAFIVVDETFKTLKERGLSIVGKLIIADGAYATWGERRVDNAVDDLCSYDGPLYRGIDGRLYIVEHNYLTGYDGGLLKRPCCWWEVAHAV